MAYSKTLLVIISSALAWSACSPKQALKSPIAEVKTDEQLIVVVDTTAEGDLPPEIVGDVDAVLEIDLAFEELKKTADSLFFDERYDQALPYWLKVLEMSGDNPQLQCEAHYVLGSIFFQKSDYGKSEREFLASIRSDSTLIDAHRDLGLVYFVQGRYDLSLKSFNQVLELSPGDSDATYWVNYTIGSAAYEKGIKAFAEEAYDRAAEQFQIAATHLESDTSANYKIYFYLGKTFIARFEYDSALAALEKCVQLNPLLSDGLVEIASVHFGMRDFERAVAYNRRALDVHPHSPKALNNLGYIYYSRAHDVAAEKGMDSARVLYESALELFERAVAIEPALTIARNNIIHVKQMLSGERTIDALTLMMEASRLNNTTERVAKYREIIAADSTYDDAYNNLGVTLYYSGELEAAEAALRKAIALDAYNYQAHNNLGLLLGSKHLFDDALRHLFIAIQIRRDYFDAYYNLGYIYMWKEDFASSRKVFLQLLKINPEDLQARKGFEEMIRREEAVRAGKSSLTIEIHEENAEGQ